MIYIKNHIIKGLLKIISILILIFYNHNMILIVIFKDFRSNRV